MAGGATKFHINDAGETGACKASVKTCKFSGNGESVDGVAGGHYSTREEATEAAEKFLDSKYKDVYKGYRKGETEGMGMAPELKKKLIAESEAGNINVSPACIGRVLSQDKDELIRKKVAETLSSQKLLRDMSDDESARVRAAVATRTNNRTVLAKLASDPDSKVRAAAIQNQSTPAKARKAAQTAIKAANLSKIAKVSQK